MRFKVEVLPSDDVLNSVLNSIKISCQLIFEVETYRGKIQIKAIDDNNYDRYELIFIDEDRKFQLSHEYLEKFLKGVVNG